MFKAVRFFSLFMAMLVLTPAPLMAQDTQTQEDNGAAPAVYSPDFCEFSVTFPTEPYQSRNCQEEAGNQCYDLVSYTQVFDMLSTVNFRVICNPVNDGVFEEYSPEVMEATLRAMTKNSVVKEFDSSFREEEAYKQAGLVGEGLSGRTPTIYIAQLWIGQKSALSVEAELIGEPREDADQLFSDVLRSVTLKANAVKAEDATATEEKKEGAADKNEAAPSP